MNGYHKRLRDFEVYDKVTLEVVPRFKASGLSGNCWRRSVRATFWFKGVRIREQWFRDMQTAVLLLGNAWLLGEDDGGAIPEEVLKAEKDGCDQPGCSRVWKVRYVLKREFSAQGERIDVDDTSGDPQWRQFCQDHADRGDCNREDCMDNYEEVR